MSNKSTFLPLSVVLTLIFFFLLSFHQFPVEALKEDVSRERPLVTRDQRRTLVVTEDGEISAVDITVENRGPYHIQFITLAPNSLLLPVLLHADMVFYVHTGTGRLSWADDNEIKKVNLRRGDVYRLPPGSVFYVESNLETERAELRIHAIFSNTEEGTYDTSIGAFSSISDLVLGFDTKVLQAAFRAPEDILEEIISATRPPAIVHVMPKKKKTLWESEARLMLRPFLGGQGGMPYMVNGKKKKSKTFNIFDAEKDVDNCNGWSLTANSRHLHTLEGSNIGIFMVSLTKGSMMGPHWNPTATVVVIVLEGQGMVRVVCPSTAMESECKNMRFMVKEGDVFAIPRFHPMAQISFNNDSLVFMGFSISKWTNYPQLLAGKSSVLQTLDEEVLAVSFNVSNTTIHQLLAPQTESIILDCTSCAEEEQRIMEEEEEEARKSKEEEERKREEEKEREERKKEEEEEREREEEERKREEEQREEEERKREQEEERKREEEEERKKREEEERQREEEKQREEEEEEKERREREKQEAETREQEEKQRREEAARREQEEARRQEKERQRRQREAEKEAKRERECEKRGDCPERQPQPEVPKRPQAAANMKRRAREWRG